jgi:hypothetical protein
VKHQPSVQAVQHVLDAYNIDQLETVNVGHIATAAGISRRSASRALGELEKAGHIRTEWVRTGKRGGQYRIYVSDPDSD